MPKLRSENGFRLDVRKPISETAQAYKRSAHDDGGVTCDIVVVVGFSLLVPFLKWAYAHQAGSRFQNGV